MATHFVGIKRHVWSYFNPGDVSWRLFDATLTVMQCVALRWRCVVIFSRWQAAHHTHAVRSFCVRWKVRKWIIWRRQRGVPYRPWIR